MKKLLIIIIFFILISCNSEIDKKYINNSLEDIENKYINIDSIPNDHSIDDLNNSYVYKLFDIGDTNFKYFIKDSKVINYIAWDTNGKKTFENGKGIIKVYKDNILYSKSNIISSQVYTYIEYYPNGKMKELSKFNGKNPVKIIRFNINGDTTYTENL